MGLAVPLVLMALVASCARGAPAPAPLPAQPGLDPQPLPREAGLDASRDAEGQSSADPSLDPRLEAKLEAYFAFADWRNTVFGTRAPNPPSALRARRIPARGPFRRASIASMEVYTFGYARSLRHCDITEQPFAPDGSLCRDVVDRPAALTMRERDSVLALLDAAEVREREAHAAHLKTARAASSCSSCSPHHVLVFLDAAGAPIGKLLMCDACSQWISRPAVSALSTTSYGDMLDEEARGLQEIFDDHQLGTFMQHTWTSELWDYVRRSHAPADGGAPERAPRAMQRGMRAAGIDTMAPASQASNEDLARLCVWFEEAHLTTNGAKWMNSRIDCPSGFSYSMPYPSGRSLATCENKKILCNAPLGRVETCLPTFVRDPTDVCSSGPAPECRDILDCLPGVTVFSH